MNRPVGGNDARMSDSRPSRLAVARSRCHRSPALPFAGAGISSADVQFLQVHEVDLMDVGQAECSTLLSSKI